MHYVSTVLSILFLVINTARAATPTFFWDFETETPNICSGGACEPHYSAGASRSTESAKDGTWSLKNEGAWSQGGVTNKTNDHVWAPMTEATVEFDWQYVAPYSQRMLFQFSGDWTYSEFDHNDGFNLRTRSENEFQLGMGYSTPSGSYKTVYMRVNVPMVDGKWYHMVCKYKQGVGFELSIDDQTFTKSTALDSIITEDRAWHLIVLGNDLKYACTQYLDNFTVYDHWVADGDTTVIPDAPLAVATASLAAGVAGSTYTAALTATGGSTPYEWSATGLPAGLGVSGGSITGTPVAAGTTDVTVIVTDADDSTASTVLELAIAAVQVTVPPDTTVEPPDTGSVPVDGNPTFFWDFETEIPNICTGGACEPHYSAGAHRSTESPKDGSWSLKNEGAWSQGGVHNFTNDHVWAPMTEGTVEFDWQYVAPYSQRMLFQFSGDWTDSEFDHNDGINLRSRSENELQLGFGYSTAGGTYETQRLRATVPMVDGKWYHLVCKYKQGVGMELTVDGQTFTLSTPLDGIITENRAWHNICLGNDLTYACTQYLDNFTIYDHWTDSSFISGIAPQTAGAVHPAPVALSANPMRDRISFSVDGSAVRSVTVYAQDGLVVHRGGCEWNGIDGNGRHAQPGVYFFRAEHADGVRYGSFMKTE